MPWRTNAIQGTVESLINSAVTVMSVTVMSTVAVTVMSVTVVSPAVR